MNFNFTPNLFSKTPHESKTRRKPFLLLLAFLLCSQWSFGQVFYEVTFEDGDPNASTYTADADLVCGSTDYFGRVDDFDINGVGSSSGSDFASEQGTHYWAGESHDDVINGSPGTCSAGAGQTSKNILFGPIDITGRPNIEVTALYGARQGTNWEGTEEITMAYSFDNSSFTTGINFLPVSTPDLEIREGGVETGTALTLTFADFSFDFATGGSTQLWLRLTMTNESSSEEVAIDHLRVAEIVVATPLSASISSQTNVSCNGGTDGSLTAAGSGGTTPYSFAWSNGPTTATNSGLTAGTYTVTITDNVAATATASATITEPTALGVSITAQENPACNGTSAGSATAAGSGGTTPYTYAWSNGATTATASSLAAGTFTVSVTDANGCGPVTTTVTITEPTAVGVSITSQTNVVCNGGSTGSATAAGSGGTTPYTYAWSNGATTATASSLAAGTFTVSVTDASGCGPASTTVTITEPVTAVSASITAQTNVACNGESTGSATAVGSNGTTPYTYAWSNGATTAAITGVPAGTFTVSVTDNNGCGPAIASATITQPTALSINLPSPGMLNCNGDNTGSATASGIGGTSPYTYAWSNGATTGTNSGLSAGTFTVTVTDANACTTASTTMISQPAAVGVSITAQTNVDCNGNSTGSATATGSGGTGAYTYAWNNGATTATITGVVAGTYTVSVTDANGCDPATTTAIITEPAPVMVTFTAPADQCVNNPPDVFVVLGMPAGAGGVYSGPGVTDGGDGLTFTFNPGTAGVGTHTLTYTYTDGNGCMGSASDMITVFAAANISFTALADLCIDAGVQMSLGGGSPSGGTYSGPGVTDNGDDTYDFDPANAGVGTHMITYTVTWCMWRNGYRYGRSLCLANSKLYGFSRYLFECRCPNVIRRRFSSQRYF